MLDIIKKDYGFEFQLYSKGWLRGSIFVYQISH